MPKKKPLNQKKITSLAELRKLTVSETSVSTPSRPSDSKKPHRFLPFSIAPQKAEPPFQSKPAETSHSVVPALDIPSIPLDPDDQALFRRVVQSVTPLAASNRKILQPVALASATQLAQKRQHAAGKPVVDLAPPLSDHFMQDIPDHIQTGYVQARHSPQLLKDLQKGKWPVEANLDLHGSRLEQARLRLMRFIQSCIEHNIRCVRIVHGKGHGSQNNKSVLKETVRRWLSQLENVEAFTEANEAQGGAGAVIALLSKEKAN